MPAIRRAQTTDKRSVESLYSIVTGAALSLTDVEWRQFVAQGGILVAEKENQIVGFGGIDLTAKEQLRWLYLRPQFRSSGVGSRILAELEKLAWRSGTQSIRLHSTPNAVEFYLKHGYTPVPEHEQFGHDHDGLEMIKVRTNCISP